ncbi:dihydroorotate dehydrogenase electron transfer subunit [bacterium]|jgi:dihydroorotate dehydrogenase electron transfer subunit|nr:dihydroorotate dehydrogenase electron transfer subunit [bacterium]MBT6831619.1 dihydroorotate dehydrogenase electron transfer subunit [bacterium]MBT6996264.1 dihydroorotate dehydrogenase electron transfer subunit [bacterium]MBT7772942.1 dihydroorotate dehydrogenase electron transfer subunit [bacterium]
MTCCGKHHGVDTEPRAFAIADFWEEAENIRTFVFHGTLHSKPGQFCMLWIPGCDEKPFSIARDYDGEIWLTICKVGPATEKLFTLKKGDKIGLRGAFGHGFTILEKIPPAPFKKGEEQKQNVVLVGGGYGTAPLHFTGKTHAENGSDVTMIIGARSENLLIWDKKSEKSGFRTLIATNDGSVGVEGFTTHVLEKLISTEKIDLVQTCGPEKMMKAIAEMCLEKNVPCEVSIERFMKCGFGVCGQCVTETGEKMCQIGPCVSAQKAMSFSDFGNYHRGPEGQKVSW